MSDDRYLDLRAEPASKKGWELAHHFVDRIWTSQKRRKPSKAFAEAAAILLAEMLRTAAVDPEAWTYRPMAAGSFTNARVGYRPFRKAVEGAVALGLIQKVRGTGGGTEPYVATRLRATDALLSLAAEHGVTAPDWSSNFKLAQRPKAIPAPVMVRASPRRVRGEKRRGPWMIFDATDPRPQAFARQVDELNAFFSTVMIDPDEHFAFQRIFNQGNEEGFNWNKGGRLYSLGGSYQTLGKQRRKAIRLNGEPTVELDIRASHLTILHAELGLSFDPGNGDPYDIPPYPRDVVKALVTMALGNNRLQSQWSQGAKDALEPMYGRLQKAFPISDVRKAMLEKLPVLRGWENCRIRWGDLQFIEAEIVIATVYELAMNHGAPALPVHDSIIVPRSKAGLAREVLTKHFQRETGVKPALIAS